MARAAQKHRDPAPVAEVRAIRRRIWEEAGNDINVVMERARREAAAFMAPKRVRAKRKTRKAA